MNQDYALYLLAETLKTAALISAPVLFASLIVGLLVSIVQVVTQIQEMTLTFVPKLIVAMFVLLVFGGWMLDTLRTFTINLFLQAALP